ncbi:MAG: acyl-CoA/acyl-ACP dehydrogenase [Acidimicrobiia bacterium]|nr:acyl-CoA/acyl-ACP dehydrogenase [Acidimicrobiia bacterium]
MDFELNDDQIALREGAADLLDGRADIQAVRRAADAGVLDRDLFAAMVEQGWTGLLVPEDEGGLDLGVVEAAVVLEEAGRHLAPVPLLPTLLAIEALRSARAAGVADLDSWISSLVTGDLLGAVAWNPEPAGLMATSDEIPLLTGRSTPTVGAPSADVVVVVAVSPDAGSSNAESSHAGSSDTGARALFVVDLDAAGRPTAEPAMDRTRQVGWLEFDGTPAVRLGDERAAEAVLDLGAALTSVEMLGAASAVLDMSVDYAKERVQFGRPIGSFQAVKHRCADMLVDVEGMRSTAYWAAWCLGADDPEASVAASTAKIWCSDAAKRVMDSGLQVHGGIGFTWEHDLHLFLKRSHLDQVSFGDADHHRQRLATMLRSRVVAGEPVL